MSLDYAETQLKIEAPEGMHELGVRIGRVLAAGDLVILTGPLGAGKTTLTRGIGEGLGVRGPIQSPTFVLARTHPSLVGGAPLIHVDAYRLGSAGELDDLDLDYEGSVVVAEWGAGMLDVGDSWVEVRIDRPGGGDADPGAADPDNPDPDAASVADSDIADDIDDDLVEPRAVTVRGYGPRWQAGVL